MLNVFLLLGVMVVNPIPNVPKNDEQNKINESMLLSKADGDDSKNTPEADHDWDHHDHGDHDGDWDHHHHDHDDDDDWDHHHHHDGDDGDDHWW